MPGQLTRLLIQQQMQEDAQRRQDAQRQLELGTQREHDLLQTLIKAGGTEKDIWDVGQSLKYTTPADLQTLATTAKILDKQRKDAEALNQLAGEKQVNMLGASLAPQPTAMGTLAENPAAIGATGVNIAQTIAQLGQSAPEQIAPFMQRIGAAKTAATLENQQTVAGETRKLSTDVSLDVSRAAIQQRQDTRQRAVIAEANALAGGQAGLIGGFDTSLSASTERLRAAGIANPEAAAREAIQIAPSVQAGNVAQMRIAGLQQSQAVLDRAQRAYETKTSKLDDRLAYANSAEETLSLAAQGNAIAAEAAKTQIARLSGEVGNLTEQDVQRFGGSKAISARLEQAATQLASGTLTPQNQAYLMQIVSAFKTALTRQKQLIASSFAKRLLTSSPNGVPLARNVQEAWGMIDPGLPMPENTQSGAGLSKEEQDALSKY